MRRALGRLFLLLVALPILMGTSLVAPQRIWGVGSSNDFGTCAHRLSTATNNFAIYVRFYWFGPYASTSGTQFSQVLLWNGTLGTDGYLFLISQSPGSGGSAFGVEAVAFVPGATAVYSNAGSSTVPSINAWNTLIIQRNAGTWELRLNGTNLTGIQNSSAAPSGGFGDAVTIGKDTGSTNYFHGIISDIAFWVGSSSGPLSSSDKTTLDGGPDPTTVENALCVWAVKPTGAGSTEADRIGTNTVTITGTLPITSPSSGGVSRSRLQGQ